MYKHILIKILQEVWLKISDRWYLNPDYIWDIFKYRAIILYLHYKTIFSDVIYRGFINAIKKIKNQEWNCLMISGISGYYPEDDSGTGR